MLRLLERRGVLDDGDLDRLVDAPLVLAGMTAASVRGIVATGDRAGMRVRRVLSDPDSARRYLERAGMPADAPALASARAPPQEEMHFDI